MPAGFLAQLLLEEISAYRHERDDAERRSMLLRAAALGGGRSTSLDVDEVLDVLCDTVRQLGFVEPTVFEIDGPADTAQLAARSVWQSRRHLAIPASDPRVIAAVRARDTGTLVFRAHTGGAPPTELLPGEAPRPGHQTLVAVPVATSDRGTAVLTARWKASGAPPAPHRA